MQQGYLGKRIFSGLAIRTMIIASTTAALADNEVNERQRDQQGRIAQGVANGSMTAHETAKVEGQEAAIHREVRTERQANGGRLTPAERAQVNRQQNHTSREIFRDKHNAAHQ
jgi:hypothetical protein